MDKHFYFFRHAQTNENRDGIRYGKSSGGYLINEGIEEANRLAEYLKDKRLEIIYSSPYERAIDTAKIVANKYHDLPIKIENNLREGLFWQGEVSIKKQRKLDATYNKVNALFQKILNAPENNVAISSHGCITRALCKCAGFDIGEIKNCECFHIYQHNNRFELIDNIKSQ